jgi:hypothetical protein
LASKVLGHPGSDVVGWANEMPDDKTIKRKQIIGPTELAVSFLPSLFIIMSLPVGQSE